MLPYKLFSWNEKLQNWYLFTYYDWYRNSWMGDVEAYIRNRFLSKIHIVQLKAFKKGKYYEPEDRMFEAVFQVLVDFVEEESSIEDLEWASTLDSLDIPKDWRNPSQAVHARKTLALYRWYKFERPNRPDPWDIIFPGKKRTKETALFDITPEYGKFLDTRRKLQEAYNLEDTKKAQEVLAIRGGLWT